MPHVGMKQFPYSKSGIQQARQYAKRTGLALVNTQRETTRRPKGSRRKAA